MSIVSFPLQDLLKSIEVDVRFGGVIVPRHIVRIDLLKRNLYVSIQIIGLDMIVL
jgi:hypothetical protein